MATQITTAYRFHKLERETIVLNQPTLKPPSISANGEKLSIIDIRNGEFTIGYKVYANNGYLTFSEKGTVDLSTTAFPEGQLDVPMNATCIGEYFNDSEFSNTAILRLKGYLPSENELGTTASLYTTYTMEASNPGYKKKMYIVYLD